MFEKLNEQEIQIIKKAEEKTSTDYEIKGEYMPVESYLIIIEDLLNEIDCLEEKYNDLQQDLEDNYRPIPLDKLYGVSDSDFY